MGNSMTETLIFPSFPLPVRSDGSIACQRPAVAGPGGAD